MVENLGAAVKVEEAVEMKPFKRPMVVEVATPYSVAVKGKAKVAPELVMVMGEAPMAVKEVQEMPEAQVTEVVATDWSGFVPEP